MPGSVHVVFPHWMAIHLMTVTSHLGATYPNGSAIRLARKASIPIRFPVGLPCL